MAKNVSGSDASAGSSKPAGKNWLVLLRIFLGAYFINDSWGHFTAPYVNEFSRMVTHWAHDSSFEWYRNFLSQYVVEHAKFFAYCTAIGEFFTGVSLILGLLTGLGVMIGVVLNINYFLGDGGIWNYGLLVICLLVIMFNGAGRVFGFDKYLSKKILIKYLV